MQNVSFVTSEFIAIKDRQWKYKKANIFLKIGNKIRNKNGDANLMSHYIKFNRNSIGYGGIKLHRDDKSGEFFDMMNAMDKFAREMIKEKFPDHQYESCMKTQVFTDDNEFTHYLQFQVNDDKVESYFKFKKGGILLARDYSETFLKDATHLQIKFEPEIILTEFDKTATFKINVTRMIFANLPDKLEIEVDSEKKCLSTMIDENNYEGFTIEI